MLAEAKEGKWTIIFPTRQNVAKLARAANTEAAFAAAKAEEIVTVTPWVDKREEGAFLCIPKNAGYDITEEPVERIMKS